MTALSVTRRGQFKKKKENFVSFLSNFEDVIHYEFDLNARNVGEAVQP